MIAWKITSIDFMRWRTAGLVLSTLLNIAAVVSLFTLGLNFSIEFTGGTLVEVHYEQAVEPEAIRDALKASEFGGGMVQNFGGAESVLIRLPGAPEGTGDTMAETDLGARLEALLPGSEVRRVEFVGPQVGEELAEDGIIAAVIAMGGILVYVMLRFTFKFAVGALSATLHDVLVTMGFFSVSQLEFDLTALAAVLTIIGYSLNDTIVILDRVRENFRSMRKASAVDVMNVSLNHTLSRTINTTLATLLTVLALFFLGGEMIFSFSAALLVGVIVGIYSSIYVACPAVLALGASRQELLPVQKEGAGLDGRP